MLKRGGSKSFSLEPIYDPTNVPSTENVNQQDKEPMKNDAVKEEPLDYAQLMEPASVRKRRYFSLGVVCFTAFVLALSVSIVMTSSKPYLDLMDPEAGTQFLGLFIASQPLAQLFFSPVMGFIGNKLGSIRIPAMISILIMASGFAFYACISALPEPRRWYLFASRFIIGAAGGTTTLCYSYIASASTVKERTTALSILQMTKSFAFIIGPLIQAGFVKLGDGQDHPIGNKGIYWNMYTAPAWLAVLLSLLNIIVLLPFIFKEFYIAKEEGEYLAARGLKKTEDDPEETRKKVKPDKLAMVACIFISAATQFHFNLIESLATLLVMEHLGLPSTRAVVLVGIMFSVVGLYGFVLFGVVGPLSRRIGERAVLLVGILFAMSGILCLYPYAGPLPPLKFINETDSTDLTSVFSWKNLVRDDLPTQLEELPSCYNSSLALTDGSGCPADLQPWCCEFPAIHSEQMIVGFLLIFSGVPFSIMMSNVIFSKILGPYPQGTWTGLYGAGIAVARILGPLCVTSLYAEFGMVATSGFMTSVGLLILIVYAIFYRRLVPYRHIGS